MQEDFFDTPEKITLWLMLCAMTLEGRAELRRYMNQNTVHEDADVVDWFKTAYDTLNEWESHVLKLEDAVTEIAKLRN